MSRALSEVPYGLSEAYWAGLDDFGRELYARVRPLSRAAYEVEVSLDSVDGFLDRIDGDMREAGGALELEPDFQRGHVWTSEQRVSFVEALIRGVAPNRILFNCPNWMRLKADGDLAPDTLQCIDGLQRLTAVRHFARGELTVFDGLLARDLRGTPFDPRRQHLKVAVFELQSRAELLQFYLDLNDGGTVHTHQELQRVRQLLADLREEPAQPDVCGGPSCR